MYKVVWEEPNLQIVYLKHDHKNRIVVEITDLRLNKKVERIIHHIEDGQMYVEYKGIKYFIVETE